MLMCPCAPSPPTPSPLRCQVLLVPMLSPRSYTCEDVVELHCHGGGVCPQRVLQVGLDDGKGGGSYAREGVGRRVEMAHGR